MHGILEKNSNYFINFTQKRNTYIAFYTHSDNMCYYYQSLLWKNNT